MIDGEVKGTGGMGEGKGGEGDKGDGRGGLGGDGGGDRALQEKK